MKRFLGILMLLCASLSPAAAQVAFGVRVGTAFSTMAYKVDNLVESGDRFGYSLAGLLDIPVWREFSLRPEVSFVSQGGAFDKAVWYSDDVLGVDRIYCHYYSLQIPVNICYTFTFSDVKVNLFGGPVADVPLFGNKTIRGKQSDIRFGSGEENDLKPFDIAASVGLGAEYRQFSFSVNAICGLTDRRAYKSASETSVYQNNITLSLGYFFRSR